MRKLMRCATTRLPLSTVFLWIMVLSASLAHAGKNPSVKVCNELGQVTIACHRCSTGEHLGYIVLPAGYNPLRDSCVKDIKEAMYKCSATYGIDIDDVNIRYKYWLGTNSWSCKCPENCK